MTRVISHESLERDLQAAENFKKLALEKWLEATALLGINEQKAIEIFNKPIDVTQPIGFTPECIRVGDLPGYMRRDLSADLLVKYDQHLSRCRECTDFTSNDKAQEYSRPAR